MISSIKIDDIKNSINRFLCSHIKSVNRWHYTHGSAGNNDLHIEIEFKCIKCGNLSYEYIYDPDAMRRFSNEYQTKEWR